MEFIILLDSLTCNTIYESRYDNYNSYHYIHLFSHRTKYSLYLFRPSSRVTIFIIIKYTIIYIYMANSNVSKTIFYIVMSLLSLSILSAVVFVAIKYSSIEFWVAFIVLAFFIFTMIRANRQD